ncbi:MAG TPA: hypothetical protein VJ998_08615, partial [Pseudomonadales bacterium]|nr:hypothetical protein [Pseudomonadales bacterium]
MRQDTSPRHDASAGESATQHHVVELPDASYLLYGELSRNGFDLVITNPAGEKFVVHDYFSFQPPPTLEIANGAALTPQAVAALLPHAFDQVMYAGPATSGGVPQEVGTVRFVHGDVTITRSDGTVVHAKVGTEIYKGDRVHTGHDAFVNIRTTDDSHLNLGHDADTTIQNYQYEPAQKVGHFDFMVRAGGFKYQSGDMGSFSMQHPHTEIHTPSAIISVRGSALSGSVDPVTGSTIIVQAAGILDVTDIHGNNLVELTTPGNTTVIVSVGAAPTFLATPPAHVEQVLQQTLPPPASDHADQQINQQNQQNQQNEQQHNQPQGGEGGAQHNTQGNGEQQGQGGNQNSQGQGNGEDKQQTNSTSTQTTTLVADPTLSSQSTIDQGSQTGGSGTGTSGD